MANGGPEIEQLIQLLARLPGLGPRSARRAVLQLIKKKDSLMIPLSAALDRAVDAVHICEVCGNVDTRSPCGICADPRRRQRHADRRRGRRRPLGAGARRRRRGQVPCARRRAVAARRRRARTICRSMQLLHRAPEFTEIVLAVNATVEGQTTAHYITDRLAGHRHQGHPARAWRAGRRRARLSRRRHAEPGAQGPHGDVV